MPRRKIAGCTQTTSVLFFVNFILRTLVKRKTKSVLKLSEKFKKFVKLLKAVWIIISMPTP
jgi:hypothetical protein